MKLTTTFARSLRADMQAELRDLELLDDPLGKLAAGSVWRVFLKDPAQQMAATADREAVRECLLWVGNSAVHRTFS